MRREKTPTSQTNKLRQSQGKSKPPVAQRSISFISLAAVFFIFAVCWLLLRMYSSNADYQLVAEAQQLIERDPDAAERVLSLIKDESLPGFQVARSKILVRQGRFSEAEEAAREWTTSAPEDSDAWATLAESQRGLLKVVPAKNSLEKSIFYANSPDRRDSLRKKLFAVNLLLDDGVEARRVLESVESASNRAELNRSLSYAALLRLEGQTSDAIELASQFVDDRASRLPALMLRGILFLDLSQFLQAEADLQQVVELEPKNKEAHYKLALALRGLNRMGDAEQHMAISQALLQ